MNQKCLLIALILSLILSPIAARGTLAKTPSFLQKAFQNVQEGIDKLINARDENSQDSFNLLAETLIKVVDLSLAELRDLKLKLTSFSGLDKESSRWSDETLAWLNETADFYHSQKEAIEELKNDKKATASDVKNLAKELKEWRETKFLPKIDQVYNFILIHLEREAIQTAQNRFQKISQNISLLERQDLKDKDLTEIFELLERAKKLINEGDQLNRQGQDIFLELNSPTTTETAVSFNQEESSSTSTFFSSLFSSSSKSETTSSREKTSTLLIKDLIKESLNKIRETYQLFIEISNSVRKWLK